MAHVNYTLRGPTFHHGEKERCNYHGGWPLRNGDLCHRALKLHKMRPALVFFHHHSNTKSNSYHSHDDKKLVKWDKRILFQMTARFNETARLDSYLEIQNNTHLKEKKQKPSSELISCFAKQ